MEPAFSQRLAMQPALVDIESGSPAPCTGIRGKCAGGDHGEEAYSRGHTH